MKYIKYVWRYFRIPKGLKPPEAAILSQFLTPTAFSEREQWIALARKALKSPRCSKPKPYEPAFLYQSKNGKLTLIAQNGRPIEQINLTQQAKELQNKGNSK